MELIQELDIQALVDAIKYQSPLMVDKEKISTTDICKYYNNGITITAVECFESMENNANKYYVYNFKEAPDKFAFSGCMLTKLFDGLYTQAGGDHEAVQSYLSTGVCKLKLVDKKSADKKRSYTDFELLK